MRSFEDRARWPWRRSAALGGGPSVAPEDLGEQVLALLDALGNGQAWQGEVSFVRQDGRPETVWLTATPSPAQPSPGSASETLSDLSVRRAAEALIAHHANHDALTDLPNRSALVDLVDGVLASGPTGHRSASLILLDVGTAEIVTEAFGHAAGERVVLHCAVDLARGMHEQDFLARLSDHVFAVWCPHGTSRSDCQAHGEDLRSRLSRPYDVAGMGVLLRVSAAVALAGPDLSDAAELLQRAGTALRRARVDHSTRTFDGTMRDELLRQLELERLVHRILSTGDVALAYQPIVRLQDQRTFGAEALLRVVDDEGAPVPADELVEAAERNGQMTELGDLVLRTACRAAARWARVVPDRTVHVSVNVSARQLDDGSLPRRVAAALDASGLAAPMLCLEVTESALMDNPARSRSLLAELKAQGVALAADDFGTGYSSLAYLKAFPLDALKVDRSFVAGLPDDPEDAAITQAVVAMAEALGLAVVAEGVENTEQRDALVAFGTTYGQGFLWDRAVPIDVFEARLASEAHLLPAASDDCR